MERSIRESLFSLSLSAFVVFLSACGFWLLTGCLDDESAGRLFLGALLFGILSLAFGYSLKGRARRDDSPTVAR